MSSSIRDIFRGSRPRPEDDPDAYYPNGVRRQPMDERLPSGESAMNIGLPKDIRDMITRETVRGQQRQGTPPTPSVLTPTNQATITRPRRAMDVVRQAASAPLGSTPDTATTITERPEDYLRNDSPTATRDRRTQPRDFIADDEAALRQLENQKEPFWKRAVIAGINAAQAGFGERPTEISTSRTRDIDRLQNQLGRDIKVQAERTRASQNELIPVQLDNGDTVMVPARTAGALRSRQQEIGQRDTRLEAQQKRWNAMTSRDRRRDISAMYRSGALNTPEGLEYAARELDIPVDLMPAFISGQMRDAIDENGNYTQINRQTGVPTATGVKSYETVKEAGRDRRATQSQKAAMQRTVVSQDRQDARAAARTTPARSIDGATRRQAAKLVSAIETARRDLTSADEILNNPKASAEDREAAQFRRQRAQKAGETAASELNALDAGYEAGPGQGGYPYYKQRSGTAPQGRTIEGAIAAFEKSQKRKPTAEEIQRMEAALNQ